ncbi:UNVERIFIED_CONTAM: hypothetical protein H355_011744 [Colinus virginianus]|nr:hypothetical protein H355_011744 [Colinus virginianus]
MPVVVFVLCGGTRLSVPCPVACPQNKNLNSSETAGNSGFEGFQKSGEQEKYKSHPGQKCQDFEAELLTPRSMVAVFDYNPKESSPNADAEAELAFSAGDIITVFGSMDDDGFYYGELNQQRGLVPSNFLEAVTSDDNMVEELHSKDKDALLLSTESQLNADESLDHSDFSPPPPAPPSCLVMGEQCPEQASLAFLKCSDLHGQSKKKRGFFIKGKKLFKKLGSRDAWIQTKPLSVATDPTKEKKVSTLTNWNICLRSSVYFG